MTYRNEHGGEAVPKPQGSSAKRNKARAYKQEVRTAKVQTDAGMPAKRVVMSGALKGVGLDGDIDAGNQIIGYLGECKSYTAVEANGTRYIRFDLNWMWKVIEEGKLHDKPGIVVLQPKGDSRALVVVDRDQFMALLGRAYKALTGEEPQ